MHKGAIFPLLYLPPIAYFQKIIQHQQGIIIEADEHFPKQTYRNRAIIHSPNGKLNLVIPVCRGANIHTKIRDVKISYEFNWQRMHWMSLQTSYRSSAFFEFYEDEFAPFYEKKIDFLFDYNESFLQLLFKLLKLNVDYTFSTDFKKEYREIDDYRQSIHPKSVSEFQTKKYFQVFDDRNGFMANLSVADLLFNQGPQSLQFLR